MLIYLVEDNAAARDNLTRILRAESFDVVAFSSAIDAMNYMETHPLPDIALIDFRLEGGPTGVTLATRIRLKAPNVAVVMMSEFATKQDIINAFKVPVDDFLIRPFEPHELLQSISDAVVKRLAVQPSAREFQVVGNLDIDFAQQRATWHGTDLKLTRSEFVIVSQLAAHPGTVISYAELFRRVKGEQVEPSEARDRLKTHMMNIKHKFQAAHSSMGSPIRTRYAMGFFWDLNGENIRAETAKSGDEHA